MNLFQQDVAKWVKDCFGEEIANDTVERSFRFTEESLELVQSLGITRAQVLILVDYVFDRPKGEPQQEVGGVMVTLAALCNANGIQLKNAALTELLRCQSKTDKIREKHFSKPANMLSPIPDKI